MNTFISSRINDLTSPTDAQEDLSSVDTSDKNFKKLVLDYFTEVNSTDSGFNNEIGRLIQIPGSANDPETLLSWQNYLGDYNNYISLVSTLSRKAVSSIETLEKSQ